MHWHILTHRHRHTMAHWHTDTDTQRHTKTCTDAVHFGWHMQDSRRNIWVDMANVRTHFFAFNFFHWCWFSRTQRSQQVLLFSCIANSLRGASSRWRSSGRGHSLVTAWTPYCSRTMPLLPNPPCWCWVLKSSIPKLQIILLWSSNDIFTLSGIGFPKWNNDENVGICKKAVDVEFLSWQVSKLYRDIVCWTFLFSCQWLH